MVNWLGSKKDCKADIYIGTNAGNFLLKAIKDAETCIKVVSPSLGVEPVSELIKKSNEGINVTLITTDYRKSKYNKTGHDEVFLKSGLTYCFTQKTRKYEVDVPYQITNTPLLVTKISLIVFIIGCLLALTWIIINSLFNFFESFGYILLDLLIATILIKLLILVIEKLPIKKVEYRKQEQEQLIED